jgi:hypothetical protein
VKRLRGAVRVTFQEEEIKQAIDELRVFNSDLKALREQILDLEKPQLDVQRQNPSKKRKQPSSKSRYESIRAASQTLYNVLRTSWCCNESSHNSHHARLFLDAKSPGHFEMDIAILWDLHAEDILGRYVLFPRLEVCYSCRNISG